MAIQNLIIRSSGGSWISARNNVAVRGTATTKDSWNPVVGQATPNGYWTIGNLASNDNLAFSYTSNTNYNAGKNSATTVYLPVQEGAIITSATIGSQSVKYATSAGSAGSVAWGNVSGKEQIAAEAFVLIAEFLTGCVLNLWLGLGIWDYSNLPGNILGQTSWQFALLFLPVCAFGIILDDYLRYWFFNEDEPHYNFKLK